jgi:hypothetical protein
MKTIFHALLVLLANLTDPVVARQLKQQARELQFAKAENEQLRDRLPERVILTPQERLIQVIALAQYACTRCHAADRTAAKADRPHEEIALGREEMRLKDARMERIPPAQRPHYLPTERLAILELRAARGWSLAQTGAVFHVTTATIVSWTQRLDEQGPDALLRTTQPVNKSPTSSATWYSACKRSVPDSAR